MYVDARDRSGKTVSSRGTVAVSRAEVKVGLTLDRWFAARGDDVNVAVDVETIAGVSPAGVPVTLSFGNFNGEPDAGRDDEVSLITDAGGIARAHWHCDRAGYVRIVATARDTRGRETRATSYIWVSATKYGYSYRFDTASISAQKATYAPGETARLLITSPQADVDALVNVSGDGDSVTVVRHLAGNASTIDVPVPADAAHAIVSVWIPAPQGVLAAATRLDIRPTPHALAVKIHPAEPKYAPGDIARFAVDVRDERGRPVRSEIGLSVVDDALLALATPADNARAFDAFYTNTRDEPSATADWSLDDPIIVYTVYAPIRTIGTVRTRSASSAFQPGQTSDTFTVTVTEKNASLQDLRTDFRDTAYWAPAVMTDVHGHAEISFRWPDNLTSYTASGLAVTEATSIGNGDGASARFERLSRAPRHPALHAHERSRSARCERERAERLARHAVAVLRAGPRNRRSDHSVELRSRRFGERALRRRGTARSDPPSCAWQARAIASRTGSRGVFPSKATASSRTCALPARFRRMRRSGSR